LASRLSDLLTKLEVRQESLATRLSDIPEAFPIFIRASREPTDAGSSV